jgi:hypothetical protein
MWLSSDHFLFIPDHSPKGRLNHCRQSLQHWLIPLDCAYSISSDGLETVVFARATWWNLLIDLNQQLVII